MRLKGTVGSEGVAVGPAKRYVTRHLSIAQQHVEAKQAPAERERYLRAKALALKELAQLGAKAGPKDPAQTAIFNAHMEIVDDEELNDQIGHSIEGDFFTAEWAVESAYTQVTKILSAMENALIRERAADMVDVKMRLLRLLSGKTSEGLSNLEFPCIIVCDDLLPSDTAGLDRKNTLGIITQVGGATSHSAIIARSLGIPALLGVKDAMARLTDRQTIILDAIEGFVIPAPTSGEIDAYAAMQLRLSEEKRLSEAYLSRACETADGTRIEIGLNVADVSDDSLKPLAAADFIGLFRTEFIFMDASDFPTETEQFLAYQKILTAAGDKIVTLRTLDIGGDKTLRYFELPKEENPFLGKRALRLCFANMALFKTQLRAALRASAFGRLYLMLPMVGSIDDILRTKEVIGEVQDELRTQEIAFSEEVKIGIMIEIPSIAMIADRVVAHVDFASIGTNDLCQYLTAADRTNADVGAYYQDFHPAMLRLIRDVAEAFNQAGKPLSVCGELGGDALAAPLLVGLGLRKLSMGSAAIPKIKRVLSQYSVEQLQAAAREVLTLDTAQDVERRLKTLCPT